MSRAKGLALVVFSPEYECIITLLVSTVVMRRSSGSFAESSLDDSECRLIDVVGLCDAIEDAVDTAVVCE